jgi:hypothetical protein
MPTRSWPSSVGAWIHLVDSLRVFVWVHGVWGWSCRHWRPCRQVPLPCQGTVGPPWPVTSSSECPFRSTNSQARYESQRGTRQDIPHCRWPHRRRGNGGQRTCTHGCTWVHCACWPRVPMSTSMGRGGSEKRFLRRNDLFFFQKCFYVLILV